VVKRCSNANKTTLLNTLLKYSFGTNWVYSSKHKRTCF